MFYYFYHSLSFVQLRLSTSNEVYDDDDNNFDTVLDSFCCVMDDKLPCANAMVVSSTHATVTSFW